MVVLSSWELLGQIDSPLEVSDAVFTTVTSVDEVVIALEGIPQAIMALEHPHAVFIDMRLVTVVQVDDCHVVLLEVLDRWADVTQHLTNHVHAVGHQSLPWIRCLLQVFVGEFHLLMELFAIFIDGSDLDA